MKASASLVFLACFAALACGGATTSRQGDDTREGAIELAQRGLVTDGVDADGDDLDFVRFEVAAPASVTIRIDWDRPSLEARIRVLDSRGKRIHEVDHAPGTPVDRIALDLSDGQYFLEILAKRGASPYAVAVIPASDLGADAIPRPE